MKTMNELVSWFQLTFPAIVSEMKKSDHHLNNKNLNPHHLEGNIWEHSLMVCLQAKHSSPVVQMAALLHDIGKPFVREVHNDRVRFFSHEPVGAFLSLDVLSQVDWLDDEEKVQVFRAICHHTDVYKLDTKEINRLFMNEPVLSNVVKELSICDSLGRFTFSEDRLKEYSYNEKEPFVDKGKEVVILVGIPNSGKSTRAKELISQGYHVVSSDDIIMEMSPDMTYNEAYDVVNHKKVADKFNERLRESIKYSKVVIDTCNTSKKRRANLVNIFKKSHNLNCEVFLVPISEIHRRNRDRSGKHIPNEVYDKMIKSFHSPSFSEGFDKLKWNMWNEV